MGGGGGGATTTAGLERAAAAASSVSPHTGGSAASRSRPHDAHGPILASRRTAMLDAGSTSGADAERSN